LGYKIKKLENEKMGSDKKNFLTGLTCRTNQTGQDFRKETEEIIKRLGGFRVGLAYRELIGSLYESWTIGIERVYK